MNNNQDENRKLFYDCLTDLIDQFDEQELLYMDHVLLEAIEYWKGEREKEYSFGKIPLKKCMEALKCESTNT